MEALSRPMPEPETHRREEDPLFHEDEDLALIYEGRKFYMECLDGSKVVVTPDMPGMRPASSVTPSSSTRKRAPHPQAPNRLTSPPNGRCLKRPRKEMAPLGSHPQEAEEAPT